MDQDDPGGAIECSGVSLVFDECRNTGYNVNGLDSNGFYHWNIRSSSIYDFWQQIIKLLREFLIIRKIKLFGIKGSAEYF